MSQLHIMPKTMISISQYPHMAYMEQDGRKEKRNKMQIYHDILDAIKQEKINGPVKPTRVQFLSNMSYDKLTVYLDDLASKKMITKNPLALEDRGNQFLLDYEIIHEHVKKLGLEYL